MIKTIKEWLSGKDKRRDDDEYRKGFDWALGQYFSGSMSILEIESTVLVIDYSQHTFGVRDALQRIDKLCLTKEDELFSNYINHLMPKSD